MAEENDSGLIREIDEELRQEQLATLAKKYGKTAVGVVVLIIASVGGYKAWEAYDYNARSEATAQLATAMTATAEGRQADATNALVSLAENGPAEIAALAKMRRAALIAGQGDAEGAIRLYESLTDDQSLDQHFRDIAALHAATLLMDSGDIAAALWRLGSLTQPDNPWRHSARELAAVGHLETGDTAKARNLLSDVIQDPAAPQGVRARATEILDSIDPE